MRKRPSIYNELRRRDLENLLEAIRHDKYWRVYPGDSRFFYTVILSRARTPSPRGRLVRVTGFGQLVAAGEAARFCRKYRVGIVDSRARALISVLTWRAFSWIMRNCASGIYAKLSSGSLPSYINIRQAKLQCLDNQELLAGAGQDNGA